MPIFCCNPLAKFQLHLACALVGKGEISKLTSHTEIVIHSYPVLFITDAPTEPCKRGWYCASDQTTPDEDQSCRTCCLMGCNCSAKHGLFFT